MSLEQVVAGAGAADVVNENFQAVEAAALYGRKPGAGGLVFTYYGGHFNGNDVADGTHTLGASSTLYVVAALATGVVSSATGTTNWNDTANYFRIGLAVTGASTITSFADKRDFASGSGGGGGGSGTVTSVGLTMPGIFSVASSPVTTSGTLGVTATDPAADRLVFWDDSASDLAYLTLGTNLSITGTTINAAAGGSVAGSNLQVQYNNAGAFGAEAGFEYDQSTNTLTVGNVTIGSGGRVSTAASATGGSGLRVPHGTAPTSPTNGDVWTTTTGLFARINGATVGPFLQTATITGWTASLNTTSPNGTVSVAKFLATGAQTTIDVTIETKGGGAFQLSTPDGSATGGNKRGIQSVDLQMLRAAATDVASGAQAVIGGGQNNEASGNTSTVAGGDANKATAGGATVAGGGSNIASNSYSTVAGGVSNTASGFRTFVGGGATGVASGDYSYVIAGLNNTASGHYSCATGWYADTKSLQGSFAYANGNFAASGDAQTRRVVLRTTTTTTTPTGATSDGAAISGTNQINLPTDTVVKFMAEVVAYKSSTGDAASWVVTGLAKNLAGTTSLVGTPTVTKEFNDAGASTWSLAVAADNTNDCISFNVTGQASSTIRWVVSARSVEVA